MEDKMDSCELIIRFPCLGCGTELKHTTKTKPIPLNHKNREELYDTLGTVYDEALADSNEHVKCHECGYQNPAQK